MCVTVLFVFSSIWLWNTFVSNDIPLEFSRPNRCINAFSNPKHINYILSQYIRNISLSQYITNNISVCALKKYILITACISIELIFIAALCLTWGIIVLQVGRWAVSKETFQELVVFQLDQSLHVEVRHLEWDVFQKREGKWRRGWE